MKSDKVKLPQKIIVLPNEDKKDAEHWGDRYKSVNKLANFPASFRMTIIGKPNSGKSNLIKNILLHQKPEFEKIHIWSSSKLSREYEVIEDATHYDHCPTEDELTDEIDPETLKPVKSVLICDDIQFESLKKDDVEAFTHLMKHVSSQYNVSVICTAHDLIQMPKVCRRLSDIVILFRIQPETIKIIGQKIGMPNEVIYKMFQDNIVDFHDNLCIDMTFNSPAKFRKNLFERIDENKYSLPQPKKCNFPIINFV